MESVLGLRVAADWLGAEQRGLLTYYGHWLEHDPQMLGWGLWLIEVRAERTVIGSIGFKGKPTVSGVIEIGYGISPSYWRKGYTFEAAEALVQWAFEQPEVQAIIAECLPDNLGSKRILEKLGMQQTKPENGYLKWILVKR